MLLEKLPLWWLFDIDAHRGRWGEVEANFKTLANKNAIKPPKNFVGFLI
jgi:hypothetical protein